jgi:antitoxin component of MazEF toxin-antitoxin module
MAEVEVLTKTRAIGGSLVVTLPKELVKFEELKEGQIVKIKVEKVKRSWFGILKGLKSFSKKEELKGQLGERKR